MNQIHLKASNGRIIATLPAYESLYQVPLSRYIDFLKAREALDDKEKLEAGELNIPRVLAQSVGAFMGLSIYDVISAEYGNFEDEESEIKNLTSTYVWIINLLGTFTGKIRTQEDCIFTYKGERYIIPVIGSQVLTSLPLLPDLETGGSIEAYEIKRKAQAKIESDDPEGSHLFSYYLGLLAVLCRKKDGLSDSDMDKPYLQKYITTCRDRGHILDSGRIPDDLPIPENDVEGYINDRLLHFQEIDAGTALDVDFFLAGLMKPSAQTGAAVGFLSNHVFALVQAHQKRREQKPKPSIARFKEQGKRLSKSAGGKRISKSLNGGGLRKAGKAR